MKGFHAHEEASSGWNPALKRQHPNRVILTFLDPNYEPDPRNHRLIESGSCPVPATVCRPELRITLFVAINSRLVYRKAPWLTLFA